jgi:hypothetical protein
MAASKREHGLSQVQKFDHPQIEIIDEAVRSAAECSGNPVRLLVIDRSNDTFAGKHFHRHPGEIVEKISKSILT